MKLLYLIIKLNTMKLLLLMLTASITWLSIDIHTAITTIHFFNWWALWLTFVVVFSIVVVLILKDCKTWQKIN